VRDGLAGAGDGSVGEVRGKVGRVWTCSRPMVAAAWAGRRGGSREPAVAGGGSKRLQAVAADGGGRGQQDGMKA
jgi:hypothetical protein